MAEAIVDITDEEIDAALERAQHVPELPPAVSAHYDVGLDAIVIELVGGRRLLLPRKELQGLETASVEQVLEIEIHGGSDISWPQLDVDHSLPSLQAGQYGSNRWMKELERRGISDTPNNSGQAIARLKASYDLYPLMGPFCMVEGQQLRGVLNASEHESFSRLTLVFDDGSLILKAIEANDTIDVDFCATPQSGIDISQEEPWRTFLGERIGWCSLAMNQQGYLDGALLAFSKTIIPELCITAVASGLKVGLIVQSDGKSTNN